MGRSKGWGVARDRSVLKIFISAGFEGVARIRDWV